MGQALRDSVRPAALLLCSEPFARDMARLTLRASGYSVTVATSSEDLAETCATLHPRLIVVDEAALVTIPEHLSRFPTIVLLSAASPLSRDESRRLAARSALSGAPAYHLAAPFSPLELDRAARRVRRLVRISGPVSVTAMAPVPEA